eukprot:6043927-Karenia_brevis.AAC.1
MSLESVWQEYGKGPGRGAGRGSGKALEESLNGLGRSGEGEGFLGTVFGMSWKCPGQILSWS